MIVATLTLPLTFWGHIYRVDAGRCPKKAKEGQMAAQLKEPQSAPAHAVRLKTFNRIANSCTERKGEPSGLIKFVNATRALSKKG